MCDDTGKCNIWRGSCGSIKECRAANALTCDDTGKCNICRAVDAVSIKECRGAMQHKNALMCDDTAK